MGNLILHQLTNFSLSLLTCQNCQLLAYNAKGLLTFLTMLKILLVLI
jgi:hypothetical protein